MTTTRSESLIEVPREGKGTLLPLIPDLPWTTTPIHMIQKRTGLVYVDSPHSPRNMVVVVRGDEGPGNFDQAFLFGLPSADGLRTFVSTAERPTEFICDDDLAPMVLEFHPDASSREAVAHWYDRLDAPSLPEPPAAVRRLRLADADGLATLVPAWHFRTFVSPKEMLMGGACYGVEADGALVAVAYTVDQSVKYERISVQVAESHRRRGFGYAAAHRLLQHCFDGGRLPCGLAPRRSGAALMLGRRLGFPERALLRTYLAKVPEKGTSLTK